MPRYTGSHEISDKFYVAYRIFITIRAETPLCYTILFSNKTFFTWFYIFFSIASNCHSHVTVLLNGMKCNIGKFVSN